MSGGVVTASGLAQSRSSEVQRDRDLVDVCSRLDALVRRDAAVDRHPLFASCPAGVNAAAAGAVAPDQGGG